jgi:hypothetical protein
LIKRRYQQLNWLEPRFLEPVGLQFERGTFEPVVI